MTRATFLVTGVECPGCVRSLVASLSQVKGVKSATVSVRPPYAIVEFDESQISVQKVALAFKDAPQFMGKFDPYRASLLLPVDGVSDRAAAKSAASALRAVAGVKRTYVNARKRLATIDFDVKGSATTKELLEALQKGGYLKVGTSGRSLC